MSKPTRETTCGHQPYKAKGLCKKCYDAAYHAANRERRNAAASEWHKANPGRTAARAKAWRETNPERARARNKVWRDANPERADALSRAWQKAHPERSVIRSAARRARGYGADVDLTLEQWLAVVAAADGHCSYCDRDDLPLGMEHAIPLSRGGAHNVENVRVSCSPCNLRKGTKTAEEFMAQQDLTA